MKLLNDQADMQGVAYQPQGALAEQSAANAEK